MVWENDRKLIVLIVLGAVTHDREAPVVLIVHLGVTPAGVPF